MIIRICTIVLMLFFANTNVLAYDIEHEGIYYNLDTQSKSAEVTSNPNKFAG